MIHLNPSFSKQTFKFFQHLPSLPSLLIIIIAFNEGRRRRKPSKIPGMKLSDARNDATLIYGEKNEASTRATASLPVELVNPGRQPGFPAARSVPKASFWSPAGNKESKSLERATGNSAAAWLWKICNDFSYHPCFFILRVIFKCYSNLFYFCTTWFEFKWKFVRSRVVALIVDAFVFFFNSRSFFRI